MPERTCVGCRRKAEKDELVRVVRRPDGATACDPDATAPGRGAYLCRDVRCFDQAMRRGRLARALRCGIDPARADELRTEFEESVRGAR